MDFVVSLVFFLVAIMIMLGIAGAMAMGLYHWYLYIRREYGPRGE